MPEVGKKVPSLKGLTGDGNELKLASYKGQWVVLYFYPKDMSTGCTIEAHNFQADMSKYEHLNAVIVGVSVDSTSSHQQFCAKEGLHFKLLSDEDKTVVQQYGSLMDRAGMKMAQRNTFLISPQGKIVKVWTGVNPNTHSQDVLAELTEVAKKS